MVDRSLFNHEHEVPAFFIFLPEGNCHHEGPLSTHARFVIEGFRTAPRRGRFTGFRENCLIRPFKLRLTRAIVVILTGLHEDYVICPLQLRATRFAARYGATYLLQFL
jgi:hypothetical protein